MLRVVEQGFRHEALVYSGKEAFLAGTLPFIHDAVSSGEPIMVAVNGEKIELLESRLGGAAERVLFADMRQIGRNPALIIPAWQDFVAENSRGGKGLRGIGEPICAERGDAELAECHHHESLLNLAFAGGPSWWLLCPYDTESLSPSVIAGAEQNHPLIYEEGVERESGSYREPADTRAPFAGRLPEPPVAPDELAFDSPADVERTRRFVADKAIAEGIGRDRADGLALAVDEVVTNALRHGEGRGTVRAWTQDGRVVCEVADAGTISDPLVGRVRPDLRRHEGRGLWIANHFCDLVQIRSSTDGTVVRCHLGPIRDRVPA
jgi:anti-sigma regulatory factor (Ser/Thr protein kinase)